MGSEPGRHALGPHVVGSRVVVRRLVRGERGPSGGPAMTDLLGECLAWADGVCLVQPASGEPVAVPIADIVSGKPVPPRASVRDRVPAVVAQQHGFALFPDLVTTPIGSWTLRDSATSTARRAHSVLAFGPSGVDDDVEQVVAHYERPVAAVQRGSDEHERLVTLGWGPESTDGDTLFLVAGLAQVARALRAVDDRGCELDVVHPGRWARARLGERASGYAAFSRDWIGFGGITVAAPYRRQGLALAVMAALVEWGAELGATTAYLQVLEGNTAARALYDGLGFRLHHAYCYLAPPAP